MFCRRGLFSLVLCVSLFLLSACNEDNFRTVTEVGDSANGSSVPSDNQGGDGEIEVVVGDGDDDGGEDDGGDDDGGDDDGGDDDGGDDDGGDDDGGDDDGGDDDDGVHEDDEHEKKHEKCSHSRKCSCKKRKKDDSLKHMCAKLTGAKDVQVIESGNSRKVIRVNGDQAILFKVRGNSVAGILEISSNRSEPLKGLCVDAAGSESKVLIRINSKVEGIIYRSRGNQIHGSIEFGDEAEVGDKFYAALGGNGASLEVSGPVCPRVRLFGNAQGVRCSGN